MPGVSVEVEALTHSYPSASGRLEVLSGLSMTVPPGGYAAVTGRSGAGKTTLLAILGGLDRPQAGGVRVGEVELGGLDGDALAAYRRSTVGFVFQHFGLLDTLTAAENVELALTLAGLPPSRRRARAGELLAGVGLAERSGHRPPALSGGERQRVALARAMANEPSLLLADEPTGNLDGDSARQVVEMMEDLRSRTGCTLVMVTHDSALADRAEQRCRLGATSAGPEREAAP